MYKKHIEISKQQIININTNKLGSKEYRKLVIQDVEKRIEFLEKRQEEFETKKQNLAK